jgi:hypothetical protein
LDLKESSALQKFEFNTDCAHLASTPGWLYRTLWKINSPLFKEFIISVSNCLSVIHLHAAISGGDWETVDAYLFAWSKFQPSFTVVFRVGFEGEDVIIARELIEQRFPLVSKKGIMRIELIQHPGTPAVV